MNQHRERLDGCVPFIRTSGLLYLEAAKTRLGITLMVVRGGENVMEHLRRYKIGRVLQNGKVVVVGATVTDAPPGKTGHNTMTREGKLASVCFDVIPLDYTGQPLWQLQSSQTGKETAEELEGRWLKTYGKPEKECWNLLWELAHKYGLDPLGDKVGEYLAYDLGHMQEPGWKIKLADLGLMLPTWDGSWGQET